MSDLNLVDAMGVAFCKSEKWLHTNVLLSAVLYALVVANTFGSGWLLKMCAILTFVAEIGVLLTRHFTGQTYSFGEKIRRLAMLKDGLGIEPSLRDFTEITSCLGFPSASGRMFVGDYYATTAPAGPKRLLQIVDECTYWTSQGAGVTSKLLLTASTVAGGITLLAFITLVQTGLSTEKVTDAFVVTISFFATGQLVELALKYRRLASASECILDSCEALLKSGPVGQETLLLADEYNCALADAGVPIPTFIYKRNQDRWNEVYRERLKKADRDTQRENA